MYILYLDDSGSVKNKDDRYFVLAGVALFERQTHFLSLEMDKLAETTRHPNPNELEFHGNVIFSGRGWWRKIRRKEDRCDLIVKGLRCLDQTQGQSALFGAVIDKQAVSPRDPTETAFEQICNRFDLFLKRLHRQGNTQRGMIVLDRSTQETRLQSLATDFRLDGHSWGKTHNIADVPFFVDSKATRTVQYADLVAYAVRRYYEKQDPRFLDVIKHRFDNEGGSLHGLVHIHGDTRDACPCVACNPAFLRN